MYSTCIMTCTIYLANIYLFIDNHRNTKKSEKIYSKLTTKTPERR